MCLKINIVMKRNLEKKFHVKRWVAKPFVYLVKLVNVIKKIVVNLINYTILKSRDYYVDTVSYE